MRHTIWIFLKTEPILVLCVLLSWLAAWMDGWLSNPGAAMPICCLEKIDPEVPGGTAYTPCSVSLQNIPHYYVQYSTSNKNISAGRGGGLLVVHISAGGEATGSRRAVKG